MQIALTPAIIQADMNEQGKTPTISYGTCIRMLQKEPTNRTVSTPTFMHEGEQEPED